MSSPSNVVATVVAAAASGATVAGSATVGTSSSKKKTISAAQKAQRVAKAAAEAISGKSVDLSVQHTNDDSVLSKRSAAKHGYLEDNYLRYFVKKPARRAPLINRGYYLRIVAMTELVEQCLQSFANKMLGSENSHSRLQVLSLGAGFDTLAPRLYLSPQYQNVHFYEVDFPPVIANKTALVSAAPKGSFPFLGDEDVIAPGSVTMNFGRYHSLGLDLRETEERLSSLLSEQGFDPNAPTVVYAECVMQYMTPECSDGVVRWAATSLPNAIFMAYDQINPYDSFGTVMQHSLRSKQSPLAGVHALPNGIALSRRAVRLGLEEVRFANFYDLSRFHLSGDEKARVDALEMFDEYEEWSEMCEHYGILCARTRKDSPFVELPLHPALVDVLAQSDADEKHLANFAEKNTVNTTSTTIATEAKQEESLLSASPWPNARLGIECYSNGSIHSEIIPSISSRRNKAGREQTNKGWASTCIVSFGGVSISKGTTRTDAVYVHSLRDGDLKVIDVTDEPKLNAPGPRSHHTFSRIAPFTYVAFGGRTNPVSVFNEAFLCEISIQECGGGGAPTAAVRWTRLASLDSAELPPPRFRHADVALENGTDFIIIGGRTESGTRLGDVWHASVDACEKKIVWRKIAFPGPSADAMPPHCTAAATLITRCPNNSNEGQNSRETTVVDVIVSGGMASDDAVVGTAFHLEIDTKTSIGSIKELEWAKRVGPNVMGRFGHTMTVLPPSASQQPPRLLLLGGLGYVPKVRTQYWQPLLVTDPLESESSNSSSANAMILTMPKGYERTSFVRHSAVKLGEAIDADVSTSSTSRCNKGLSIGIVGGGFTCFSFGIYSPTPIVLTIGGDADATTAPADSGAHEKLGVSCSSSSGLAVENGGIIPTVDDLPKVLSLPYTAEAWKRHQCSPFPVALTGMPIGNCLSHWADVTYLKQTAGKTNVAVHVANALGNKLLDFVHKNFDFRHVSFEDLVEHCWPTCTAVASTNGKKEGETWYFRSVGANMKTESSNFYRDFASLAADFVLPEEVKSVVVNPSTHHQSCFRINQSGMRLWPHYDVMDNILVNVVGHKQVVLFPPTQYTNLYMSGSSSPVLDVLRPDLERYPRALEALNTAQIVTLGPGDALIIPALWVHAITAVDACISVNLFYKRVTLMRPKEVTSAATGSAVYDGDAYDSKDLYGNKDLPAMVAARKAIMDEALRQLAQPWDASRGLEVPAEFKALMLQQLIGDLQEKAHELFVQSQMRK